MIKGIIIIMLNNLNAKIIETLENFILEYKNERLILVYKLRFLLRNYIYFSFALLISILFLNYSYFKIAIIFWLISFVCITFSNLLLFSEEEPEISKHFKKYILLDMILLFGKKNRHKQLKAFQIANFKNIINKKMLFYEMNHFYENIELSLWVEKYVKKETGVVNFFVQRYGNQKVSSFYNKRLLYWSQLLPLNIFDSNNLRTVLAICPIISRELLEQYNLEEMTQSQLNSTFSKYDNKSLFILFTNDFNINDYLKVISIAQKYNLIVPVYKNITALVHYLIEATSFQKFKKTDFCDIVIKNSQYDKISQIYSIEDLISISEYFKNCIMQLKNSLASGHNYLFVIYTENKPNVVFQVDSKFELIEAKKRFNQYLSLEELDTLKKYIESCRTELKLRQKNNIRIEV